VVLSNNQPHWLKKESPISEGKSGWLEGFMLICLYGIIALLLFPGSKQRSSSMGTTLANVAIDRTQVGNCSLFI
jgi:hypothetical protein